MVWQRRFCQSPVPIAAVRCLGTSGSRHRVSVVSRPMHRCLEKWRHARVPGYWRAQSESPLRLKLRSRCAYSRSRRSYFLRGWCDSISHDSISHPPRSLARGMKTAPVALRIGSPRLSVKQVLEARGIAGCSAVAMRSSFVSLEHLRRRNLSASRYGLRRREWSCVIGLARRRR